jgi:hypothetical protein
MEQNLYSRKKRYSIHIDNNFLEEEQDTGEVKMGRHEADEALKYSKKIQLTEVLQKVSTHSLLSASPLHVLLFCDCDLSVMLQVARTIFEAQDRACANDDPLFHQGLFDTG